MLKKERTMCTLKRIDDLANDINENGYENCINEIERFSEDQDLFVRSELAVVLADFINDHSIMILSKLLCDRSYLVQVEAIDSLKGVDNEEIKEKVKHCMNSKHPLVRGYAYIFMSLAADNTKEQLDAFSLLNEKNVWARIQLLTGMSQLGDEGSIQTLLKMYRKCNYLNRCAIANGFADLFDDYSETGKRRIQSYFASYKNPNISVAEKEAVERLKEVCLIE